MKPFSYLLRSGRSAWRTTGLCSLSAVVVVGAAWGFASSRPPPADAREFLQPASADEIIARLPREAGASRRELRARLALPAGEPDSPDLAVSLASGHYARARRYGEPRELGLAQAALGRWWKTDDAPVAVLLIRAAIMQHQHDFPAASRDLSLAILKEPSNIQAWLSQAAIHQTTGRLDEAARSCRRVVAIGNHIAGHVCLADLAGMKGDQDAFDRIERELKGRHLAAAELAWVLTVQAELAERLGRGDDADRLFRRAAEKDATSYSSVAYADFLLQQGRFDAIEPALRASPATDAVLLRRAIALQRMADPRAKAAAEDLRRRFESAASRGGSLHLREMARFALEIDADATTALELAKRNWLLQKEPADALLLAAAARAAGRPDEAAPVREFSLDPGLFDVRLKALL